MARRSMAMRLLQGCDFVAKYICFPLPGTLSQNRCLDPFYLKLSAVDLCEAQTRLRFGPQIFPHSPPLSNLRSFFAGEDRMAVVVENG